MRKKIKLNRAITALLAVALVFSLIGPVVSASSHREAPLIVGDPKADATDLYAFVSPDKSDTVTIIANYVPFQEPAGGPNFDSFDDKALYEIKIDNNGDAKPDVTYQFRFRTTVGNPDTFLYNTGPINSLDDADWNVKQTYTLTKIENGVSTVLGTDLKMPPVNVGPKSTPNYGALQAQAINDVGGGVKVFAGQSDDPFFVDLGSTFDLLTIRKLPGNAGGGVNTTQGYNVHSLALQIPTTQVTVNKNKPTDAKDPNAVIGIWTTASRQATRVLSANGTVSESGEWVQVSRLGAPLVNEVVVPRGSKDLFNASKPENDAQFAEKVANPEVPKLLKALYGINVPPQGPFGSATQRDDLTTIFLTGIPDLTKPANVKPAELLRLNVSIAPTANPNTMGVLAGDNQGYPNGRRLSDDVVDISLQAMAGAAYPLFHPEFTVDATGAKLGDGVDINDMAFRNTFPYLALPTSGFESVPHAGSSVIAGLMEVIAQLKSQIASMMGMGGGNSGGNTGGNTGNGSTGNATPRYKQTFMAQLNTPTMMPTASTTDSSTGLMGDAIFKVRDDEQVIEYTVNLTGNQSVTGIELACADSNNTGPSIASLSMNPGSTMASTTASTTGSMMFGGQLSTSSIKPNVVCNPGIQTLSHLVQAMREDKIYVNVMTSGNPSGEVRGQVR